jgi:hypothetical protein
MRSQIHMCKEEERERERGGGGGQIVHLLSRDTQHSLVKLVTLHMSASI